MHNYTHAIAGCVQVSALAAAALGSDADDSGSDSGCGSPSLAFPRQPPSTPVTPSVVTTCAMPARMEAARKQGEAAQNQARPASTPATPSVVATCMAPTHADAAKEAALKQARLSPSPVAAASGAASVQDPLLSMDLVGLLRQHQHQCVMAAQRSHGTVGVTLCRLPRRTHADAAARTPPRSGMDAAALHVTPQRTHAQGLRTSMHSSLDSSHVCHVPPRTHAGVARTPTHGGVGLHLDGQPARVHVQGARTSTHAVTTGGAAVGAQRQPLTTLQSAERMLVSVRVVQLQADACAK